MALVGWIVFVIVDRSAWQNPTVGMSVFLFSAMGVAIAVTLIEAIRFIRRKKLRKPLESPKEYKD